MKPLSEHQSQQMRKRLEGLRHQQTEVEQHVLTLWQQQQALPFQLERVQALPQSLLWHRQEGERI
jgi:hypothetical protein